MNGYIVTVTPDLDSIHYDEDQIGEEIWNIVEDDADNKYLSYEENDDIRDFLRTHDEMFDIDYTQDDTGGDYDLSPYDEWRAGNYDMYAVVGKYFLSNYNSEIIRRLSRDFTIFGSKKVSIIDGFEFPKKEAMHIKSYTDLHKYKV